MDRISSRMRLNKRGCQHKSKAMFFRKAEGVSGEPGLTG